MYLEHRYVHHAHVIDCWGRFDQTDRAQFMQAIESVPTQGYRCLILNFTSLYFLDPVIVPDILFAKEYLQESSISLILVSPLSYVRSELLTANVLHKIPTYTSVYDALHRPHSAVVSSSMNSINKATASPVYHSL